MNENLNEAMDQIKDQHIAQAIRPRKRRKLYWLAPIAAVLALVIFLSGGIPMPINNQRPLAGIATLVSAAEYPEMVPYPGEEAAWNDSESYNAWRLGLQEQYDQPQGYADGLEKFFAKAIPQFLEDSGENAVCSPLNIYMALAMLAECTDGDSREALLDVLGADSLEALGTQAGHVWNANYRSDGTAASLLANSLWLDEGLTYDQTAVDSLVSRYYASAYQGDFEDPGMTQSLRDWLSRQTQGLLDDYVNQESLDPQSVFALASTVYFRDKWDSQFSEGSNTEGLFYGPGLPQLCTFMNRTLDYGPYYYGADFSAVYLALESGGGMWLILPDEGKSLRDILDSGHALDGVLGIQPIEEARVRVHLSMPKFDISGHTDLSDGLTNLGLGDLFDPEKGDFSAILPEAEGVCLSTASHAARVTVDEEGVTAAAYTLMAAVGAAPPPEEEVWFTLDRPFLFVLTSADDLPLFAGIVNQP